MAISYFMNLIVAVETIRGGKLFKVGNYSREEVRYLKKKQSKSSLVILLFQKEAYIYIT